AGKANGSPRGSSRRADAGPPSLVGRLTILAARPTANSISGVGPDRDTGTQQLRRAPTSCKIPPPIDADRLTGDVTVPGNGRDDLGHLLGLAEAADRDQTGASAGIGADHVGLDQGRRDEVGRDAFLG